MVPHSRFSLVVLFLLSIAVPVAAQSTGTHFFTVITPKVGPVRSPGLIPAGSIVDFEISSGWAAGVVPRDVVVEIDVPGVVLSVTAPHQATCDGERPVRCSLTSTASAYQGVVVVRTQ